MPTISSGSSKTFTAAVKGQVFTVTINGGAVVSVTGAATDSIGPLPTRKSYGPFNIGQAVTIAVSAGEAQVSSGDGDPGDMGDSFPFMAVSDTSGNLVLDAGSKSIVLSATAPKTTYTIAILGDSIPQAQIGSYPQADADGLWWYSSTLSPSVPTFFLGAQFSVNSASNESATVNWDGTRMSVSIAGDSYGPAVDVTGGGFFTLNSGTNGKSLFVTIRWRNAASQSPGSITVTNTGNTYPPGRMGLAGLFSGGLMRSGLLIGNKVMNYAIGGDTPTDVLNRISQVIARAPDAVLLMIGVNNLAEAASVIPQIVARLTSAGIKVILSPTLPRNLALAGDVSNLDAAIAACKGLARGAAVQVVDLSTPMRNPGNATGAIECAAQYNADEMHPSCVATLQRLADVLDPALRQAFPNVGQRRIVNATNAYNATTNPRGNLIGARAAATGTGGALAGSPTATGNLPDNWNDLNAGGTYTSVVYTCPGSGSPIPRGDKPGAYWHAQMVATNASGGNAFRDIRLSLETAPTVGARYRFRCAMQLINVTNLVEFEIDIGFTGAVGPAKARLLQIGTLPLASNSIEDTGILYFESDDFIVPPSTTAATVTWVVGCATGGSATLRVADLDFFPV